VSDDIHGVPLGDHGRDPQFYRKWAATELAMGDLLREHGLEMTLSALIGQVVQSMGSRPEPYLLALLTDLQQALDRYRQRYAE